MTTPNIKRSNHLLDVIYGNEEDGCYFLALEVGGFKSIERNDEQYKTLFETHFRPITLGDWIVDRKGVSFIYTGADIVPVIRQSVDLDDIQRQCVEWVEQVLGGDSFHDVNFRRNHQLEEALELSQSVGMTRESAHQIVDYVFDRPVGEVGQEVAGSFFTLVVLAAQQGVSVASVIVPELQRCWDNAEKIQAKQLLKPTFE